MIKRNLKNRERKKDTFLTRNNNTYKLLGNKTSQKSMEQYFLNTKTIPHKLNKSLKLLIF